MLPAGDADDAAALIGADGCPPSPDGCPPSASPAGCPPLSAGCLPSRSPSVRPPSASPDDRPAVRGATVWALGAAAWPSPWAELRRQAIPRCALAAVGRLLGPAADADEQVAGLDVSPERHRLSLEAATPAGPADLTWGGRRPAWRALATLPETLRQAAEARSRQAHDEQFGPRMAWLEQQVAAWRAALDRLAQERLARPDGWPLLLCLREELLAKGEELRAACAAIEEWLEEAGARFARAEDDLARAGQALEALCRRFPPPDWAGAMGVLLQPWRWPWLAWAYLVALPRAGRRYLNAWARRSEARRAEANIHTLRQVYLARAQMVQERQREVDAWIAALRATAEALAQEVADLSAPPAPWDAARLAALADELSDGPGPGMSWIPEPPVSPVSPPAPPNFGGSEERPPVPPRIGGPRGQGPGGHEWPPVPPNLGGSEERPPVPPRIGGPGGHEWPPVPPNFGGSGGRGPGSAGTAARDALIAWAEGRAATLDDLRAADWLALALDDEGLADWLGERMAAAAPLWPVAGPAAEAMTWLAAQPRAGDGGSAPSSGGKRLLDCAGRLAAQSLQMNGVCDGDLRHAACQADVVAVLRAARVRLTDQEGP